MSDTATEAALAGTQPDSTAEPSATASERGQHLRLLEAVLFAASEPLDAATLTARLPDGADLEALLGELSALYANRGIVLVAVGGRWALRTAPDLAPYLRIEADVSRKLSRAAVETLATIAYHQPLTRAEIEEIRGVSASRGTIDILLETGWIKPGRRRRTPGRPLTWVTAPGFLDQFGLESLDELPGVEELKAAGLLDKRPALSAFSERGTLGQGDLLDDTEDDADPDEPLDPDADTDADGKPGAAPE